MNTRSTRTRVAARVAILGAALVAVLGLLATPAAAKPFVTVAKTAGSSSIEAGDVASFTISIANTGTTAADTVVITDVLPDGGLAWAENPDVPECAVADDAGGDVLTCNLANFASGATFSVTVEATTSPDVCDYVLSNTASILVNGRAVKTASASITVTCPPEEGGCTYTQGFWKTHPEAWPVDSLTLGSVSYTAEELLAIFGQPVAGNGLVSLAHQLIAAKLNIANGADPTDAAGDIAAADALIGGLVVPPVGSGFLAPSDTSALVDALSDYNEGLTGPGHCDDEVLDGGGGE